eukprot:9414_1
MVMDSKPSDIKVINYSDYEICYKYKSMMRFKIPAFSDSVMESEWFVTFTFAESGIFLKVAIGSTGGRQGQVYGTMIDTTAAISDIMGLLDIDENDDNYYYYFIFG